jgi:tetratricopeptide (TPR) repeat protein
MRIQSWLIATTFFLAPNLAAAQDATPYPDCTREPSDSDISAAKGAFQAGQVSFNESDYNRSITYWEDAYRRDCTAHPLLLNLARAYELNGQKKHAINALETYLARKPDSRDRASIQRRIEVLQSQLQNETAVAAPTAVPTETSAQPPPNQDLGPQPEAEPQGKRPLTPLIVAGAGGAVTLVGAILYFNARGNVSDFEKQCLGGERNRCPGDIVDDANAARTRTTIFGALTLAGVAIAAGGVIWYVMSPRQLDTAALSTKPRVAPAVGPGFTGLAVSGAF